MDPFTTPGAVSWNELMTDDPQAAATFYTTVFGWSIRVMEMPIGPYRVIKVGDTDIGGIVKNPSDGPPCWTSYITVENVDAVITTVTGAGGTVLHGPMDIPTVGRMALLQDPQGATIHIIAYAPRSD